MEELIILVEALQKGIDKNIYTNLEIKGIQVCIDKLTNTLNQDINVLQDKDNQTTEE